MHRGASLLIGVVPLRSLLADKDRSGWFIIYQYLCVLVKGMSFWDRTPKHSVRVDTAALVHTHLPPPPTLYSSPSPPLPSPPHPHLSGTGPACIYPLLATSLNKWTFVATDIDAVSLEYAVKNVSRNGMEGRIRGGEVSVHAPGCTHDDVSCCV